MNSIGLRRAMGRHGVAGSESERFFLYNDVLTESVNALMASEYRQAKALPRPIAAALGGALCVLVLATARLAADVSADVFSRSVRPVLVEHCSACHGGSGGRNPHDFLASDALSDVATRRTLWRDVATQLRNRTMPPGESKLPEADRLFVAKWIDERLRTSGCEAGEHAGYVGPRRLNRREYRNTVRDLLGADLEIADLFAADEAGGAGFDTNGATLYVPPMLIERYLEAARLVADRAVVSPPLKRVYLSHQLTPTTPPAPGDKPRRSVAPGKTLSAAATVFSEGTYSLRVSVERPAVTPLTLEVQADGVKVGELSYPADSNGGATARAASATLARRTHEIAIVNGSEPIDLYSLTVSEERDPPTPDQRAIHYRLFGLEPGQAPLEPRRAAERLFEKLLPKAYRRPVERAEVERILGLYDRAADRGDPFEESVKYALRAVLTSPRFLFRIEEPLLGEGVQPLGHYDVASRLSYFLWSTLPDEELLRLAAERKLQDPAILARQVDRMLDDPRSRSFAGAFIGQWLGTQEVGGRVVPLLTELQHFYTPEVAADLREQPELFFHYILTADRSVLDLLDARYTFLTERLARYYQVEDRVEGVGPDGFYRTQWPDDRRAGVLGLASVLAMTSHYKQSSPVLRGAWVLEKLLGTPVPPPPPDVPPLPEAKEMEARSIREVLTAHRASTACAACHNLMDPIGLGLETFDWMGRARETYADGTPIDASGALPSGERFDGPTELRQVLLGRKDEFLRNLVGKALGYAIGRGLQDGDQCVIERIVEKLRANGFRARMLIREVVLSAPFRKQQSAAESLEIQSTVSRPARRLLGTK